MLPFDPLLGKRKKSPSVKLQKSKSQNFKKKRKRTAVSTAIPGPPRTALSVVASFWSVCRDVDGVCTATSRDMMLVFSFQKPVASASASASAAARRAVAPHPRRPAAAATPPAASAAAPATAPAAATADVVAVVVADVRRLLELPLHVRERRRRDAQLVRQRDAAWAGAAADTAGPAL